MPSIIDRYPVFAAAARLHLVPSGAVAVPGVTSGKGAERKDSGLNRWATELARAMDGSRSVGELCRLALDLPDADGRPKPGETAIDDLVAVINALSASHVIELADAACPRPVPVSGRADRYSPAHASIELTDYCNIACRHCYRDSSPARSHFIDTEKLLGWLHELRQMGLTGVELTGGEPTAHPDFARILERCVQLVPLTGIISNGTLWTDELVDLAARYIDRIYLQIDLDGPTAESHDFLRGAGVFAKATDAVRRLAAKGVRVRVAMSVHGRNAHEIMATAKLARSLGAHWFGFAPVMQLGRGAHAPVLTAEHGNYLRDAQAELARTMPGFFFVAEEGVLDLSEPGENCGAGWRAVIIGPDSTVRPCLTHRAEYMNFGRLDEIGVDGVVDAIPGEALQTIPTPNFADCEGCLHMTFCAGCAARAVQAIEYHRGKKDGFVCAWAEKYDAVRVFAPGMHNQRPKSSLKWVEETNGARITLLKAMQPRA